MIPVEFTYEGKTYKGVLNPVSGMGTKAYFLEVNRRYCGELFWAEYSDTPGMPRHPSQAKYKWRFSSQSGKLDHLESVFIEALEKAGAL